MVKGQYSGIDLQRCQSEVSILDTTGLTNTGRCVCVFTGERGAVGSLLYNSDTPWPNHVIRNGSSKLSAEEGLLGRQGSTLAMFGRQQRQDAILSAVPGRLRDKMSSSVGKVKYFTKRRDFLKYKEKMQTEGFTPAAGPQAGSLSLFLGKTVLLSLSCFLGSFVFVIKTLLFLILPPASTPFYWLGPQPGAGYNPPVTFLATAQAGNSVRLKSGTPQVVMANITTATPIRFTPNPAFTWRGRLKNIHKLT
ncbi:hypothetical protein CCH79_00014311 [Gambusia affinis]|uniref:Uncharacterized protein n=1 Tax=Gambusia affinis TaxID=33528 RepID=A0A315US57_GAMAF|nr:hypothetical protein CCH79_00014311 [Gambusia affinis]